MQNKKSIISQFLIVQLRIQVSSFKEKKIKTYYDASSLRL